MSAQQSIHTVLVCDITGEKVEFLTQPGAPPKVPKGWGQLTAGAKAGEETVHHLSPEVMQKVAEFVGRLQLEKANEPQAKSPKKLRRANTPS